jgi:hypothetical protein
VRVCASARDRLPVHFVTRIARMCARAREWPQAPIHFTHLARVRSILSSAGYDLLSNVADKIERFRIIGWVLQMGFALGYCTLDDAFAFLMEAKGLPAIPGASVRLRRTLRACVVLSWAALEDGLNDALEAWGKKGQTFTGIPTGLKKRVIFVLSALSASPLDEPQFDRLREIRNNLAHPKTAPVNDELTVETAKQTFELCLATIRALSPYRIICPADQADVLRDHELVVRIREAPRPRRK